MSEMDEAIPGQKKPNIFELMFGGASGAPMMAGQTPSPQPGGMKAASTVNTGPPAVAPGAPGMTPPNQIGGFNPQGAGAPALPMPQGQQERPIPRAMNGGQEFATSQGRNGAIASSAIGSTFEAIHNITQQKKQDNIDHAKFLWEMVSTSRQAGDETTANAILGDPKNLKLIEKFLTGALPKAQGKPGEGGGSGKINEAGGVALPKPTQASQNQAALTNMDAEGLKNKDPQTLERMRGAGASLSPEDFRTVVRAETGLNLSPAQAEMIKRNAEAQQAILGMKNEVVRFATEAKAATALAVQESKNESAAKVAGIHKSATLGAAGTYAESRKTVATIMSDASKENAKTHAKAMASVKAAAPDKIVAAIWKGKMDGLKVQIQANTAAAKSLMKDNPKEAKEFEAKAVAAQQELETADQQYQASQEYDKIMKEAGVADEPDEPTEP